MQESIHTSLSSDAETLALKIPPHSIEAEQAVLGGAFLDKEAWDKVVERVREEDFYRKDHRIIFRAISALSEDGQPYDIVTVAEWLENHQLLDEAGGMRNLAALAENTPSASNISAYADIVRKRSILRQLISATSDINDTVFNPQGRSSEQILEFAEQTVFELSMGKTAFAVNIAENAAIKGQHSVAIFSMEMPGEQLAMRMMSSLGRIDQHKVRTGKLEDDDWPRLTSAVGMLQETRMFIDDTPALTPAELRARCRRISREHGLDLVVVDYLQLMQVAGTNENRATEISEISRSLKAMAKELKVPVIALSQLNRSLESRTDRRPVMSDLRESGAIEQDADVILFIYRDEVYDEESNDKGIAEIIISKQRNGPIGKVKLAFRGQYTRFENLADDYVHSSSGFSE